MSSNLIWQERASTSKFIASVWACYAPALTTRTVLADPSISVSFVQDSAGSRVVLRGPETRPRTERLVAGYSCTTIRLQPGATLQGFDAEQLLNGSITLASSATMLFRFNGTLLKFPDLDNAEVLTEQLSRLDYLTFESACSYRQSKALLPRTYARLIKRTTGLTPYQLYQLQRMQQAFRLVKQGLPAGMVAAELGFVDQAHLTRVSRQLFGHTPKQLRGLPQIP